MIFAFAFAFVLGAFFAALVMMMVASRRPEGTHSGTDGWQPRRVAVANWLRTRVAMARLQARWWKLRAWYGWYGFRAWCGTQWFRLEMYRARRAGRPIRMYSRRQGRRATSRYRAAFSARLRDCCLTTRDEAHTARCAAEKLRDAPPETGTAPAPAPGAVPTPVPAREVEASARRTPPGVEAPAATGAAPAVALAGAVPEWAAGYGPFVENAARTVAGRHAITSPHRTIPRLATVDRPPWDTAGFPALTEDVTR